MKYITLLFVCLFVTLAAQAKDPNPADFTHEAVFSGPKEEAVDTGTYTLGHCYGDTCSPGGENYATDVWCTAEMDNQVFFFEDCHIAAGTYKVKPEERSVTVLATPVKTGKPKAVKLQIWRIFDKAVGNVHWREAHYTSRVRQNHGNIHRRDAHDTTARQKC